MADSTIATTSRVRIRTFGLVAIPVLLPIAFLFFFVPSRYESSLTSSLQQKGEVLARIFAANATPQVFFEDEKGLTSLLATASRDPDVVYVRVLLPTGNTFGSSGDLSKARVVTNLERDKIGIETDHEIVHSSIDIYKDASRLGTLNLGLKRDRVIQDVRGFRTVALILTLVVLIAAGAIAFVLGNSFTTLFDQLRNSIFQTARRVDEHVDRLAAVTSAQTAAAAEESSALNETNATAVNVEQAATAAAQRAAVLIEGGVRAEEGAGSGLEAASSATAALRQVREQMSTIATTIGAFSERAAAIGEIAATVAVLAERSNLLALNAAIEAARAGPQGRGFSVVAQEMRSLADGSNRSAGQVKSIIGEIQASISRAVGDVREGERRVQNAEELADRAGESIRRFAQATREFATTGREIASSAKQQSSAIMQMVESIGHATQAGVTQLQTTKQVEETAKQLQELSRELLSSLGSSTGEGGGPASGTFGTRGAPWQPPTKSSL